MSIIILFTTWAFVLYRIYKSDTTRTPKCKVYLRYEWIYTFVFVENPRDRNDFRWEYRTKTFMYKSAEFCIRYIPLLIQHSFLLSFLHEYFDILDWYNSGKNSLHECMVFFIHKPYQKLNLSWIFVHWAQIVARSTFPLCKLNSFPRHSTRKLRAKWKCSFRLRPNFARAEINVKFLV